MRPRMVIYVPLGKAAEYIKKYPNAIIKVCTQEKLKRLSKGGD